MESLKTAINEIPLKTTVNGSSQIYDVIVVGAGFSGIAALYRLRKLGLKTRVFEAGNDFGGVWYWNRYPGARVDSEFPFYQLNIPEAYKGWNFSQRFPDHRELRKYMAHLDKTLGLRKDVSFESRVEDCGWDKESKRWTIKTAKGDVATARYIVLATGLLHRRHYPDFPGLQEYKGVVHHSGFWPEDLSVKGKNVAVIGAGATSVQIVQELAKEAGQLTMFMRRPSFCLPMRQRKVTDEEQLGFKAYYPALFSSGRDSAVGFPFARNPMKVQDASPEEVEAHFEEIWQGGGFQFLLRNYNNVVLDKEANKVVYDFWKKKVRERLTDPKKQELMAPDVAPYYFSTKRSPLEHDYYEMLDKPNVEIVDLNKSPLRTFTETGMIMEGGDKREFDYVILATGFDSFSGSLTHMGLKNKDGTDIRDVWADGVKTYLGMTMHGFPNSFMVYSPQAPTALSNGPTIIEAQIDFIVDTIAKLDSEGAVTIEPTEQAQNEWGYLLDEMNKNTLYPLTNSWWTGGNIPGKTVQNMSYLGGINTYEKQCREKMEGWKGFQVTKA